MPKLGQFVRSLAVLVSIALVASISFSHGLQVPAAESAPGAVFVQDEATASDLNGDGDTTDYVVQIRNEKGALTNLRLAVSMVCRGTLSPPFESCQPVLPVTDGSIVAFLVGESAQGLDLNGDGEMSDDVLHVYDMKHALLVTTRLTAARAVGRDTSSYSFPVPPVVSGGGVALLVGETEQGNIDLNRDGDANDDVLHILEPKSLATLNLSLASASTVGPFGAHNPVALQVEHQMVNFVAGEPEQGTADLNSDGDALDQVPYVLNMRNGTLKPAR
jgi:hypothetical protein